MPSFDVVSQLDFQEVDNAVNQANKEVSHRYDFKGSKTNFDWRPAEKKIVLMAEDDYKLGAAKDILQSKLIKRGLPLKNFTYENAEAATGQMLRQEITIEEGISKEKGKKIVKLIKDTKIKVQAQIMDDQVRVTGKKIDDLQSVISALKTTETVELDLQFVNMRS